MQETQQNLSLTNTDPDATLVQPRFDEAEAQTAQPVVPLARAATWRRQTLPLALVVVSALLGGLVSVAAYRLYQRRAQAQTQTQTPARADEQQQPAPQDQQTAQAARSHASDDAAPAQPAQPAERKQITAGETTKVAESGAKPQEADAHPAVAGARAASKTAEERRAAQGEDEGSPPARSGAPHARRVDVIASPNATERDRRRDDDATDQILPERRGDRRPPRPRARNIDRIRDIFGAPPPSY
ncbi:MAG: hypothetical protein LC746_01560 [Acidobacteria bacterium]|nr:hypothetical protein [Acidobacteriota bacterium]